MPSLWYWVGFNVFVLVMLVVDLGVFHRKAHTVRIKESVAWTAVWISLALLFSIFIYYAYANHWGGFGRPDAVYPKGLTGGQAASQFLTAYLMEESLSVDNLFVFLLIFTHFGVQPAHQHRVLFWGILGAIVMRALFIIGGIELVHRFHWLIYLFGAFLVYTGVRLAFKKDEDVQPEGNIILRLARRWLPVTPTPHGEEPHFFVRHDGRLMATPLFIVLLVIESTDLMFATDSIPVVIGVTQDRFIGYTSNIFAILGLRAIYFALAGMMEVFHFLHWGLSLILVFIGVKMLIGSWVEIPIGAALGVVVAVLGASVILSLIFPKRKSDAKAQA